jgi:uncharacterized membrane protein
MSHAFFLIEKFLKQDSVLVEMFLIICLMLSMALKCLYKNLTLPKRKEFIRWHVLRTVSRYLHMEIVRIIACHVPVLTIIEAFLWNCYQSIFLHILELYSYNQKNEKHIKSYWKKGFPWDVWTKCPIQLHWQFKGHQKVQTSVLKAVVDCYFSIWYHFGFPGSLNDLNISSKYEIDLVF